MESDDLAHIDALEGARAALHTDEAPRPEVLDAVWDGLLGVPVAPSVPSQMSLRRTAVGRLNRRVS